MALIPVQNTLGLWQDSNWNQETPGLYAVIVGVSNYPHLEDGSAPAKETYKLRQLDVSAQTAAAVFDWLRSDYQHENLPVVWCYLLLSPSNAEESFLQKKNITHYANPTDSELRRAIQLWYSRLPTQQVSTEKSRTLFFFSGHGVQANWHPLILPSDYLFPPDGTPVLENCVSVRDMLDWMKTHPVSEHLALIDACRNEFSPLRTKASTANTLFPKNSPGGPSPKVVGSFSATAANSIAYQSSGVDEFTFFGRALIEGLDGADGKTTVHGAYGLDVEFMNLVKYVKPRVITLLKRANTTLEQIPHPSLDPCDASLIVTQIPVGRTQPVVRSIMRGVSTDITPPLGPSEANWPDEAEKIQDSHFNIKSDVGMPVSRMRDFSTAHPYFGHEYATEFWSGFQLYTLSDRRPLSDDQVDVLRVSRDDDSSLVRVDMDLHPNSGGLLVVFQRTARGLQAVPLPTDPNNFVPVRLTLAFDRHGLLRIQGQLGPSNHLHYDYLWKLTRIAKFASFADAAKEADTNKLIAAARDKMQAPTAAIAGAIILATGGKIRRINDWTRNMMNWFPDVPDGAVLWAESLRASILAGEKKPFNESDPLGAMVDALGSLEHRGVPFFVDAIELLDSQLRYLDGMRGSLSRTQLRSLVAVRHMVNQVFQIASPSGHFLMLAALPRPISIGSPDSPLELEEMLDLLRPQAK